MISAGVANFLTINLVNKVFDTVIVFLFVAFVKTKIVSGIFTAVHMHKYFILHINRVVYCTSI